MRFSVHHLSILVFATGAAAAQPSIMNMNSLADGIGSLNPSAAGFSQNLQAAAGIQASWSEHIRSCARDVGGSEGGTSQTFGRNAEAFREAAMCLKAVSD